MLLLAVLAGAAGDPNRPADGVPVADQVMAELRAAGVARTQLLKEQQEWAVEKEKLELLKSTVLLWAGHLAESAKDWPEAETFYTEAARRTGPTARLATLYLARLLLDRRRTDEAARLLRTYLDSNPEDSAARTLLAVAEARKQRSAGRPNADGVA